MPYLDMRDISKTFGDRRALERVSASVERGEFVCILGPSGCGKTTLLRVVAGLETPDAGTVLIDGRDVTNLRPSERNFGIVFQSYALFPNLTAYENVAYGLKSRRASTRATQRAVLGMLRTVHLEDCRDAYPSQLSGGQQQRVALARALVLSPNLLLLDEPLSALDAKVRSMLRGEITEIVRSLGITTLMVTHDQEEALTMADRIIVMNRSRVEQTGTPQEIYERPATSFVADFVGSVNFLVLRRHPSGRIAIRPEDVSVGLTPSVDSLRAVVSATEYRGAFWRLVLDSDGSNILSDVPARDFAASEFRVGQDVYVRIPESRIIPALRLA